MWDEIINFSGQAKYFMSPGLFGNILLQNVGFCGFLWDFLVKSASHQKVGGEKWGFIVKSLCFCGVWWGIVGVAVSGGSV